MKVDLNWKLKTLDGVEMQSDIEDNVHVGKLVANLLSRSTDNINPVKIWDQSIKLYNKKPLELDSVGFNDFKKFIHDHESLFNIAKGQILNYLEGIKE